MHWKDSSVLALTLDPPANAYDPFLAGGQVASQVSVVFAPIRLWHQHVDVLPKQLVGSIPEHSFRSRIDAVYAAGAVDRQDSINGGLQNCMQHG